MKRLLIIAVGCLFLTGCSLLPGHILPETTISPPAQSSVPEPAETPAEPSSAAPEQRYQIYLPNENADGFDIQTLYVAEITGESVLKELQKHNVLPDDMVLNYLEVGGTQLNLDFNQAFADLICSMGTSGEAMIVGSVVNTYLSAFQSLQVERVFFTIEGNILESGHVVYDFPMEFME